MDNFSVRHAERSAEPFSPYLYEVRMDGRLIAEIRHSYRGEDYQVRTVGEWMNCDQILSGGGTEPLRLTKDGEKLIGGLLA